MTERNNVALTFATMSQPPDDPQPPAPPKITAEERRARHIERMAVIRLRLAIARALEDRGITTNAAIVEALGMPPAEVTKLMTGKVWRPGEVAELQAVAARPGMQVPD